MLKLRKKFWMQTSNVVCGVGQVWIDKKTHKCKCVSRLLSMIAVTGQLQFLSTFEMINKYPNPRVHLNCNLQLFILEKCCRKKCTRQSWKVLWVVLSSLFFRKRKKFETMAREAMSLCLRVLKENNKSRFDNYRVRNSVLIISHIIVRDCRVQFFSDNLSQNSCIQRTCQVSGHCMYSSQTL